MRAQMGMQIHAELCDSLEALASLATRNSTTISIAQRARIFRFAKSADATRNSIRRPLFRMSRRDSCVVVCRLTWRRLATASPHFCCAICCCCFRYYLVDA